MSSSESPQRIFSFFFFNDTATTEIYTLSLHDALPISRVLMTVQVQSREQVEQATEALEQRSAHSLEHMTYGAPSDGDIGGSVEDEPLELPEGARVGRNDPCPCGSGKKYKQCHGKLS